MTRAEHLQWCKDRALAYLKPEQPVATIGMYDDRRYKYADGGIGTWPDRPVTPQQLADAIASLVSDLTKHPATQNHMAIVLSGMEALGGGLKTAAQVRHFIEGCN